MGGGFEEDERPDETYRDGTGEVSGGGSTFDMNDGREADAEAEMDADMEAAEVGVARIVLGLFGVSSAAGGSNRLPKGDPLVVVVVVRSAARGVIISLMAVDLGGVEGIAGL